VFDCEASHAALEQRCAELSGSLDSDIEASVASTIATVIGLFAFRHDQALGSGEGFVVLPKG
jgi:hypothetical protein